METFNIGDIVAVKKDFQKLSYVDTPGYNQNMIEQQGRIFEISEIIKRTFPQRYHLNGSRWSWDGRWLERIDDTPIIFDESDFMEVLNE